MSFFTLSLPSRAFTRDKENDENRPSNARAPAVPRIPQGVLTKRDENAQHIRLPRDKTPVTSFEPEECTEHQGKPESCVTEPPKTGPDLSHVRTPSSTYAPEGGLSSQSDHDESSANSINGGRLTSISSIELFCGTRFDLDWTRSHSTVGVEQGPNLMEELAAATGSHEDIQASLPTTAPNLETATSGGVEAPPRVVQWADVSIRPSESELEGISSTDRHLRGRHFLGIHKWAKAFWKSRARFLQGISLGKAKKKMMTSKDGRSGNKENTV
ncbi:hypothetical protein PG994_000199 [Apiospora phragmitis]|uniref:Uncharacterized protein n=1 Tax=Apiospora phragmitis TaxID=2905665 RepID=A0ABR1X5S4_9PEZI